LTPITHTVTAKIGIYDAEERSVRVTFTSGEIQHKRSVNAVLTEAGEYDAEATAARVDEVAAGVAQKIACGAITASK
jgi:hypothetical protein